ncbi:MAG: phosphatidylserine decarboxylase [Acidiferrobacterales bacterium]|nr:phosphatidylserine decarboxylase [Acidiferrobacterales bacterium]
MSSFDYPILAREGRVHLILAAIAGIFSTWLWGWWSLPVWLLVLFVFQFFRDPKRQISEQPGAIVAPASGQVVFIGETGNPYLEGVTSLKVSIFMNVFSVHSNLVPIGGEIRDCWYHAGKFFNAALDKASSENERNAIWIRTPEGEDVISIQIAGLVARRILSYVKKGDQVQTGQRYGFIRFGSRVDLYLPVGTPLNVNMGQWVTSGNDVVANFSR